MITDDIAEEILLRLPVRSLVRCRLLSKDWHEFICRNPSFRKRFIERNKGCSFMIGLYLTKHREMVKLNDPVHFLSTYNKGISVFGESKRNNNERRGDKLLKKKTILSLKRDDNGRVSDKPLKKKRRLDPTPALLLKKSPNFFVDPAVRVLGSSNGFLLCSLDAECPLNYIIINPINKLCVSLPVASISGYCYSHGFICHSNSPQLDTIDYYKVVRGISPEERYTRSPLTLEIISSDSSQWSSFHVRGRFPFFLDYRSPSNIIISEIGLVYVCGYAYVEEASDRGVFIFDQSNEELVQPIKLFPPSKRDWICEDGIGESEGMILYARAELGKLKIWTMNDYEGGVGWTLICNVSQENWYYTYPDFFKSTEYKTTYESTDNLDFSFLGFHPTNKNVVFCGGTPGKVLAFHIDKSKVEFICDLDSQSWKCVYYFYPYVCGLIGPHLFVCD